MRILSVVLMNETTNDGATNMKTTQEIRDAAAYAFEFARDIRNGAGLLPAYWDALAWSMAFSAVAKARNGERDFILERQCIEVAKMARVAPKITYRQFITP
jgi:hypothetical protein